MTGSLAFRHMAALRLIRLGIAVVNPPLDLGELALAREVARQAAVAVKATSHPGLACSAHPQMSA